MSDLIIKDGDLQLNSNNTDLRYYLTEENSIIDNLQRRILTDINQYQVYYYDTLKENFKSLDSDYGSNIRAYVAAPNNILFSKAKEEIANSLAKETRLKAVLTKLVNLNDYSPQFTIEYEYKGRSNTVTI